MTNKSNPPLFQQTGNSLSALAEFLTTSPSMLCKALGAPGHRPKYGPRLWGVRRKSKPATVHEPGTGSRVLSAGCGPRACAPGGGVRRVRPVFRISWQLRLTAAASRAPPVVAGPRVSPGAARSPGGHRGPQGAEERRGPASAPGGTVEHAPRQHGLPDPTDRPPGVPHLPRQRGRPQCFRPRHGAWPRGADAAGLPGEP